MTGIYLVEMCDVVRAAGVQVGESSTTAGWQTRARSSGGFPTMPLGVQWHHTASQTSPANDLGYMIRGNPDAPVGNCLLDRGGVFWPVAAGAANTAGKGGPLTMSRGVVPLDGANARTFAIEAANNGVGEGWPQAQIDAYFAVSNAINAWCGNTPADLFTHALGAGDGWTNRKIDPATAGAVAGPWRPGSVNSSGTWSLADIRAEATRRAGTTPAPRPPSGDDMATVIKGDGSDTYWAWNGVNVAGIPDLQWVTWGVEAGLYANADPVVYPQALVDALVAQQAER